MRRQNFDCTPVKNMRWFRNVPFVISLFFLHFSSELLSSWLFFLSVNENLELNKVEWLQFHVSLLFNQKYPFNLQSCLLYSHFLNPISLLVIFLSLLPLYYPVWLPTIPPFLKDSIPLSAIVFLLSPQTTPIMR